MSSLQYRYSCCIPNCANSYYGGSTTNKHFFRFPPTRNLEWNNAIKAVHPSCTIKKSSRICEDHFSVDNFFSTEKTRLLPSALPDFPLRSDQNNLIDEIDLDNCVSSTSSTDISNNQPNTGTISPFVEKRSRFSNEIDIKRKNQLINRKKFFYDISKRQIEQLTRLKKIIERSKHKLKLAEKISHSKLFLQLKQSISNNGVQFISSLFRNSNSRKHEERWTPDDKVFALALYKKRGPQSYRFLSKFLRLPSIPTLKTVLNSFLFDTGINNQIFQKLAVKVSKFSTLDKFCCLMFDEMSLSQDLHYDRALDKVVGPVDLGSNLGQFKEVASHSLVFMISGLYKSWKQPIAYYFTNDQVEATHLKILIKEVIVALQEIGLRVICTVCDQGTTNSAAIKQLINECHTDQPGPYFIVNAQKVVALHDPPHLLKNTRNALKCYNIQFDDNKIAKWEHIIQGHNYDNDKRFKNMYKIDSEHLALQHPLLKMKVSIAANTMSYSVAAVLEHISMLPEYPSSAVHTAEFIGDIDQLFDSLNAANSGLEGKELSRCVNKKTKHIEFWYNILEKIKTWKFLHPVTGLEIKAPRCKEGWITTIQGVIMVWDECRKAGFKYLRTRTLNQDPVENLFSLIRHHVSGHTNLTPYQFILAFKTCILNRLATPRSLRKNCEDDGLDILEDFKKSVKFK